MFSLPLERSKYCGPGDPNPIFFHLFLVKYLERLFYTRTAFLGITIKLAVLTTGDIVGIFFGVRRYFTHSIILLIFQWYCKPKVYIIQGPRRNTCILRELLRVDVAK